MKNRLFIPLSLLVSFMITISIFLILKNITTIEKNQLHNILSVPLFLSPLPKEKEETIKKRVIPKQPKIIEQPEKKITKNIQKNITPMKLDIDISQIKPIKNSDLDSLVPKIDISSISSTYSIDISTTPLITIPPKYPYRAKMRKIEGYVKLEFTITKEGLVKDIRIIESSPKNTFEKSAINSIRRWKFKPKIEDGKKVSQRATQTIEFKLK